MRAASNTSSSGSGSRGASSTPASTAESPSKARRSGSRRPTNPVLNDAGRVVKVVKYAAEVTSRVRESAELSGVVEAVGRSSAVIEFELDGTIITANDNFLAAMGYTLGEVRGRHHRMFVDPDYAESEDYKQFWRTLARGDFRAGQFQRFGRGGKEIWIQASYNPILDPSGKPVKVIKVATDITGQVETKRKASRVGAAVASSVNEMVSTIEEISKNVARTASLARQAEGVADLTTSHVDDLGNASHEIGKVVGVIQDLADQTNLLALNATIEAARAGEHGHSFAVVASEVKELAGATAKATKDIEQSVRRIQDSIGQVVDSTGRITKDIGEVSTNTTMVAAAIEEQSATMTSLGETAVDLEGLTTDA